MLGHRNITVAITAFSTIYFAISIWSTLLPLYLQNEIGLSSVWIGVVVTSQIAASSLALIPFGRLSDAIGRKVPLVAGSGLLAGTTILLYFATDLVSITVLMILYGVSQGLMLPAVNALIGETGEPSKSGTTYATFNFATLTATSVGAFLAGVFALRFGYLNLFLIGASLTLPGFAILLLIREGSFDASRRYDHALKTSIKTSLTGTISLFKSERDLAWLGIGLFIHGISFAMLFPYIPLFAEKGVGLDLVQVGLIMAFRDVGLAVGLFPFGKVTDRFGSRLTLLLHFFLASISWILYAVSFNFVFAFCAIIFVGLVSAMDFPARRTLMIEYSSKEAGKATIIGSLDAINGFGRILGPFFGGLMWLNIGYTGPFTIAALLNFFGCIPLILILRRKSLRYS
jgi:MFS family permease